ncbi:MAG: GNAT family N-acetyltransferase [Clostridia bacterium]|nr:GNAT family N-acetyltransferase [Oscillospiraceae bacterium]MBR6747734.1 GNAT family N-acetyltransferase [Clostridia bacterium]
MPDMLVKLYDLPDSAPVYAALAEQGITIKRVMTPNYNVVTDWIRTHFGDGWACEAGSAVYRQPSGLFVAVCGKEILGFAACNATAKDYFGPTGVLESARGKGIGRALLLRALEALREEGYAYAIIGGVGPQGFYRKACGAILIPDSSPGIYSDLL